jgi:hypothetical protein
MTVKYMYLMEMWIEVGRKKTNKTNSKHGNPDKLQARRRNLKYCKSGPVTIICIY